MLHVSIFIELLRSQPRATFWAATLAQAAVWWLVPSLFYAAPPGELPHVLAMGHEFQLGTWQGPPLAYWTAEIVFRIGGTTAVYLAAQVCIVVAYWALFALARAIVGVHHAVIAVLLMIGVSAMTLPTPDFGPAVMAMPLTALVFLHAWRAVGEGRRAYWFLLAIEIGFLLLTTYAGLIPVALLVVFVAATARGRAVLRTPEPWMAGVVILVMLLPHLIWIDLTGSDGGLNAFVHRLRGADPLADLSAWLRMLALVAIAHAGLLVLVVLASGWWTRWMRAPDTAPRFVRGPVDSFVRHYVFFLALAPIIAATVTAALAGSHTPTGGIGTHVLLSGLAVVVAAGPVIAVHRQRIVGYAWTLLLVVPPALTVAAILVLPWAAGIELKVAEPAGEMGRYFGDSFERRTGRPLAIVTGEPRLAALVALAAPARPSVYDYTQPDRTPWVRDEDIRAKGAIVLWIAADTAGAPPPDIRARFPDLVPELPRVFAHVIQGRVPLARIGWGVIRPRTSAGQPPSGPPSAAQ